MAVGRSVGSSLWLWSDMVPSSLFFKCDPGLTPDGSGILSDPALIDEEFRKAWLLYFSRSRACLLFSDFEREVEGWLPILEEVDLPTLSGEMLLEVVKKKGLTAWRLGWLRTGGSQALSKLLLVFCV